MSVHDETPAETIRRAIEQMRTGFWPCDRAAADLLEALLSRYDSVLETFPPGSRPGAVAAAENVHGFDAALRLARTYLGETP